LRRIKKAGSRSWAGVFAFPHQAHQTGENAPFLNIEKDESRRYEKEKNPILHSHARG
jgi:hypothetical protein